MKAYIYKVTLNNDKSYIGMRISEEVDLEYLGSSFNRSYWIDMDNYGTKDIVVLHHGEFKTRKEIEVMEGQFIKENGLWPNSYNLYYLENGKFIKSLERFESWSKEEEREYYKRYREVNREKILEQNREYKKRNYEKILEQNREYHKKNKDALSIKHKEYHLANKEKINNRSREWYLKNKDEHNKRRREKRQKEKEAQNNQ